MVQPGTCVDGSETRDIVNPEVGDAFISEWMANPAAVDNRSGEWVELRFEAAVDLNGLEQVLVPGLLLGVLLLIVKPPVFAFLLRGAGEAGGLPWA